jgi:membrane protease YdiL (CAAX protease family)
MTAMPNSSGRSTRGVLAGTLAGGWFLLGLGAFLYARIKHIPEWAALPIAAAFLIEFPFYILPGWEGPLSWLKRQGLKRHGRIQAGCLLAASALAPWLVYSLATGDARWTHFLALLAVAVVVSLWYIVLPASPVVDILFLIAVAAIYLSKIFDRIYLSPIPKLSISVLGHLMLIRTAALAVLVFRGNVRAEFRFLPNRAEWFAGLRYFGMMLPVLGFAYWALGLVNRRPQTRGAGLTALIAIGTFLGILWVVALSEEFFFRGLLQQWIEGWTGSPLRGLILASAVFGLAHLGFHRIFPNWRWAIVAAILGLFCGLAWQKSRSVQAPMVAHALIVTVWQVFFR